MPQIKIFCTHCTKLKDREEPLINKFKSLSIPVEWVTGFDSEFISLPQTSQFRNINEFSNYKKHQYCFQQQVLYRYDFICIVEDDVVIPDNFVEYLTTCLNEFVEMSGDILFLGRCCDISPSNIIPGKHVYHEPHFLSRCAHCYVVPLKTSLKVANEFDKDPFVALDFKLNDFIIKHKLMSCYGEPGIDQRTALKEIPSSLNNYKV